MKLSKTATKQIIKAVKQTQESLLQRAQELVDMAEDERERQRDLSNYYRGAADGVNSTVSDLLETLGIEDEDTEPSSN